MIQEPPTLPQSVLNPYTGGHSVIHGGYVFELCPGHRKANPFGFVAQHRLVVERHLGHYLPPGIQVHNKDEVKTNNLLDNLEMMTRAEHQRHHIANRPGMIGRAPLTEESVRRELQKGGLKKAAAVLRVDTQTIRNRFPDLVAPYKRRSPNQIDDPVAIAKVLSVAPNDKVGYREVARETGISYRTVRRICERRGIDWNPKGAPVPTGRPPGTSKILKDKDMADKVRELAPDDRYGLQEIAEVLGISAPSVSQILKVHSIPWVRKNKAGYKHKNPRRKSNHQSSEPCVLPNGPARQLAGLYHREPRR